MELTENFQTAIKFLIPSKKIIKVINQEKVLYIRAESNYSVFVLDDKTEWTICKTLEKIEKCLKPNTFFRCHKSYIVNLSKIQEISRQQFEIVIADNVRLPISRRKRKEFITVLQN